MNGKNMIEARELTQCLACGGTHLEMVLDLTEQPLANSFISSPEEPEPKFPLKLNVCKNCTHLQLSHAVNPDLLFKNYLYVSGTSQTLRDYFNWFASYTLQYNQNATTVLDIACNDGSQLNSYKDIGLTTYGIDPAENLYELSSKNHNIVCDYLTEQYVDLYKDKHIDIITAQNVFAHNSYPLEFLQICKEIMHDNSFLFIQTSQAEMIKNNEFDTIYHEHLSFFNSYSMNELAKRSGLTLIDIVKTPIHGNSYVFVFGKTQKPRKNVHQMLIQEASEGLQSMDTYREYAKNAIRIVKDLTKTIDAYRSRGYTIAGYGAAAKGNTLLNFADIKLDFIIDDNPLKQGLFAPGTHAPVVSIEILDQFKDKNIAFVPLAWNFFSEISNKIKSVRDYENDVFIKYFPNISVE